MVGAVLMTVGYFLSAFTTSLEALFFTYGVIVGKLDFGLATEGVVDRGWGWAGHGSSLLSMFAFRKYLDLFPVLRFLFFFLLVMHFVRVPHSHLTIPLLIVLGFIKSCAHVFLFAKCTVPYLCNRHGYLIHMITKCFPFSFRLNIPSIFFDACPPAVFYCRGQKWLMALT